MALEDKSFENIRAMLDLLAVYSMRTAERVEQLFEAQKQTDAKVNTVADSVQKLTGVVGTLFEAQQNTQAHVNSIAVHLDQLAEKVDKLTGIVERHITEGHGNGQKG